MQTAVTAKNSSGKELSVIIELPANLDEALDYCGDAVIYDCFMITVRNLVQGVIRRMMTDKLEANGDLVPGKNADEIAEFLTSWKPLARAEKAAKVNKAAAKKVEAFKQVFSVMTEAERQELIAQLMASAAQAE